jgi:hypothetical protein
MNAVDPFAGEISERRKVLFCREPARLKTAHLARRSRCIRGRLSADYPPHRGIMAQPLSVVHIFISGKSPKYGLPQHPDQSMSAILASACFGERITRHRAEAQCVVQLFWDHCLWADGAMINFERQIHQILFPSVEFLWKDYCRTNGLDPLTVLLTSRWLNYKCDVQAIWSHIHYKRDVFVTNDQNFHRTGKKRALIALGAGQVELPQDAQSLV